MADATAALVYRYKSALYVNLTNRCPTACAFCIKGRWKMVYRGLDMDLGAEEPEAGAFTGLIKEAWLQKPFKELVFCGYGEPTMRLEELLATAGAVKTGALNPVPDNLRVRLNTNGLGSLINGRDIVPELRGLIDAAHVSLNTADPAQWLALMRPSSEYALKGFESAVAFIKACVGLLPETAITAIAGIGADLEKIRALAGELGAGFRIRPALD